MKTNTIQTMVMLQHCGTTITAMDHTGHIATAKASGLARIRSSSCSVRRAAVGQATQQYDTALAALATATGEH